MEKRKKTRPPSITDDLAIVKAAAWAWYQRGSGSDGRPMTEHDFTRSHRANVPSRYKLEAMKKTCQESTTKGSQYSSPSPLSSPANTDNSLLDHYEIERISRELDYYMESSGAQRSHRREVAWPEREKSGKKKSKSGNGKKKSGFWSMRGGVVCGSKDDVVESGGVRRPEKYVRMVRVANFLPRVAHS